MNAVVMFNMHIVANIDPINNVALLMCYICSLGWYYWQAYPQNFNKLMQTNSKLSIKHTA